MAHKKLPSGGCIFAFMRLNKVKHEEDTNTFILFFLKLFKPYFAVDSWKCLGISGYKKDKTGRDTLYKP